MSKTNNILISSSAPGQIIRFGTPYLVQVGNTLYWIYADLTGAYLCYIKSTNKGISWDLPVQISANACSYIAIWFDEWSGINDGLIHCAYVSATLHDVFYINIDTNNSDALSAETTVFTGVSSSSGGTLSITRTRGGNIICGGAIDGGIELYSYKSTDVGATWTSISAVSEATGDQLILLPGWAVDNQDAMGLFWDASANEISMKLYDDSGDSWAETSIATSMVDVVASTSYPHFAATVDIANSYNMLVAWSAIDSANANLRCWQITESTQTEVTNVVLNSTDDQGECAISINRNTNEIYVYYGGKSDGSETWNSIVNVYYKISKDGGTIWGEETKLTNNSIFLTNLFCCPITTIPIYCVYIYKEVFAGTAALYNIYIALDTNSHHANLILGI